MNLIVHRTPDLVGKITLPASKSQTIRGIFLASLAKGESTLINILDSEDTQAAISVCKNLGAQIIPDGTNLLIRSDVIKSNTDLINSGNSGITTRFVMPILGLRQNWHEPIVLDCDEQMRARPIQSLVDALTKLGLTIKYLKTSGSLPVAISGKLLGGKAEVAGVTSQYLSALLVSLSCAQHDSEIIVKNLHERPYVEMTLSWLQKQKIFYEYQCVGDEDIYNIKGNQHYKNFSAAITGDFSSASYFMAAAALTCSDVELSGLDMDDPQGDKRLVNILQEMGADITVKPGQINIRGGRRLTGIKVDANDIPDLLPTLAVLGTQAEGVTEICNVKQARIKETDRIHSMTTGLRQLGAQVSEYEDGMTISHSKLSGANVNGFNDHRTVMALSVAGMLAEGTTVINGGEAVNKTFPNYVKMMQALNAKMEVNNETKE